MADSLYFDQELSEHGQTACHDVADQAATGICSPAQLARRFPEHPLESGHIPEHYPMKITPHYLSLIQNPGDPLWRQAVPDAAELEETGLVGDPLEEERQSPVPGLLHRYPDRVVFLASENCAMHCRHCMRRRIVRTHPQIRNARHNEAIAYIERHRAIREVILSGGDPFMLTDAVITELLKRLHAIAHVQVLRIHTRIPCTWPQRITHRLAVILKRFHPLFIHIQFNHPAEINPASTRACRLLADAGIPLGCQSVLLKGVNDDAQTMRRLVRALVSIRVKPYYLHHPDPVAGTAHFRVPLGRGMEIMRALRGNISGICVPQYMLDLPGGGGKIPLLPQYIQSETGNRLIVKNFEGKLYEYPLN